MPLSPSRRVIRDALVFLLGAWLSACAILFTRLRGCPAPSPPVTVIAPNLDAITTTPSPAYSVSQRDAGTVPVPVILPVVHAPEPPRPRDIPVALVEASMDPVPQHSELFVQSTVSTRMPSSALYGVTRSRVKYWNAPLQAMLTQGGDQGRNKIGRAVATNFDVELQPTTQLPNGLNQAMEARSERQVVWNNTALSYDRLCPSATANDAVLHLRQRIGLHRLPTAWTRLQSASLNSAWDVTPGAAPSPAPRICVLLPWTQANPAGLPWFRYWLRSVQVNAPFFHWLLIVDRESETAPPVLSSAPNVHWHTVQERGYGSFADIFERRLNTGAPRAFRVPVNVAHIKDLKPTFGLVFAEWVTAHACTHWGFGDTDVIYGDLRRFITPRDLVRYDIVSVVSHDLPWMRLAGQLAIFQNTPRNMQLFRTVDTYERWMGDAYENYFDELHFPETLHQTMCASWLLIFGQQSDIDQEDSGFGFAWVRGRLLTVQRLPPPVAPAVTLDDRQAVTAQQTRFGELGGALGIVTESALLHFYRCKHHVRTPLGSANDSAWFIDVNMAAEQGPLPSMQFRSANIATSPPDAGGSDVIVLDLQGT